jgi:hypothetical protein
MANLQRYVTSAPSQLLGHILDRPELVAAVRELPASTLSRLIDRVGLEDSGELIALASTEQLQAMFDEDLWRSDGSDDEERFDPQRFALWLELMNEAGIEFLVRRLVELPVDLLTLAVHRAVLVIDMEALQSALAGARDEAGEIEKALESSVSEEWEEFRLLSRDPDTWDLVWDSLLTLDRDHHELLRTILEQCCAMSTEFINGQGGLYEVLTSDEMLESDARAERDDRRAAGGYVGAGDARGFLELAANDGPAPRERDAITAAYFRALDPSGGETRRAEAQLLLGAKAGGGKVHELMQLIEASEAAAENEQRPRALAAPKQTKPAHKPGGAAQRKRAKSAPPPSAAPVALARGSQPSEKSALARALAALSTTQPAVHTARMEELGYLANVLISGCKHEGRKLRPVEALEAAVATSSLGLELWKRAKHEPADATELVQSVGCDRLFRAAWPVLQRELVQRARRALERAASLVDPEGVHAIETLLRSDAVFGLRELCEPSDLGLAEPAFAALLALAESLPWLSSDVDAAPTPSIWIASRAALDEARKRVIELAPTVGD